MKFDKYYENLIVDDKINTTFITYLSVKHFENNLLKTDRVTNKSIPDLGVNYNLRFNEFYNNIKDCLGFNIDDIDQIFNYTFPHIEKILNDPHQKIVKENKLLEKNKLKNIEPKTMVWLASKSGATIKEKLANVDKVSSIIKRYSNNMKENQVLLCYFKKMNKLFNQKISFIKEYPTLFGDYKNDKNYIALSRKYRKIRQILREDFTEVVAKEHITPNNALIGNVDYASIWKSYLRVKNEDIDYSDSFNQYKKIVFISFILYMMNYYDFVEGYSSFDNITNYVLYRKMNDKLEQIKIDNNFNIVHTIFNLSPGECPILSENMYKIDLVLNKNESKRGLPFNLMIDGKCTLRSYADLLGLKDIITIIIARLGFKKISKNHVNRKAGNTDYFSINSYDNNLYGEQILNEHIIIDSGLYVPNELYDISKENIYLNTYENTNYSDLLKTASKELDLQKNKIIIYDINDNYDQFSSIKLRTNFSSVFPSSYPVWRSILAGESVSDNLRIKHVVDLCGKELSITSIGHKNNKLVHKGAIDIPLYIDEITELSLYQNYLNLYKEKYDVDWDYSINDDLINSGLLNKLFVKKEGNVISLFENKYYCITFDREIFDDLIGDINSLIASLSVKDFPKSETIFIVPNFYNGNSNNIVNNNELVKGSRVIIDRINKQEVTWYELLPELSLEIIKDGMYDNLKILSNNECENIIGRKMIFDVKGDFILERGEKNYILPLIKSFIGENNKSFVARIEDESFPLSEDLIVKMKIEYSFDSENSYNLIFEPKGESKPFKSISAIWEEDTLHKDIIDLNIIDAIPNNDLQNMKNELDDRKKFIDVNFEKLKNGIYETPKKKAVCDFFVKDIKYIANDYQRVMKSGSDDIKKILIEFINTNKIVDKINFVLELLNSNVKTYSTQFKKFFIRDLESYLIEFTGDYNYILSDKLMYPECVYGRYLAFDPYNEEVISHAYNTLLNIISNNEYLGNERLHSFITNLTSATTIDHLAIRKITEVNPAFSLKLFKVILRLFNDISNYDWPEFTSDRLLQKREVSIITRLSNELLIAFLYCRDKIIFSDFRPGNKYANEFIFLLKKFNKNYQLKMKANPDENISKRMKTKYIFSGVELPEGLNNVLLEVYLIILCLSGDERVNLITVVDTNE